MKTNSAPLLIIGTQRSGSNLLRLMLNQLPEIEAPHPPHILTVFTPLLPLYGDLNKEGNFGQLAKDVVAYVNANPVAWFGLTYTADAVLAQCRGNTLADLFRAVYEIKAAAKGARYWCCKSMSNINYLDQTSAIGMEPFYIHLLRDGRDVAASFKNSIVGEKHIYFIAQQWKKDQQICAALAGKTPANRFKIIRYEEFISNPKQALVPALQMLGIEWTDDVLKFYLSDEAKRTAAAGDMWKNVVKPVDSGNMRHYSEKLTADEIAIFESVAGDMLDYYGYSRDVKGRARGFSEIEINAFKLQNEQLKQEARSKYVLDASVRVPQEQIVKAIKARSGLSSN